MWLLILCVHFGTHQNMLSGITKHCILAFASKLSRVTNCRNSIVRVKHLCNTIVTYSGHHSINIILIIQSLAGYVQGMNELLSPLMVVLQSEHQSFWCLVNVLQRMVRTCTLI